MGVDDDYLRPSLLDRLVDGADAANPLHHQLGVRELKVQVRRDLERLLNTRVVTDGAMANWSEASQSVLTYGLPDLSGFSRNNHHDNARICELIMDAIQTFEPRLASRSVKVLPRPAAGIDDMSMHFRIDAMLHVDPIREPVSFDTNVDLETGQVHLEEVD